MINLTGLPTNWNVIKGRLKTGFTTLISNDLPFAKYNHKETISRFKIRMIKAKESLGKFILQL